MKLIINYFLTYKNYKIIIPILYVISASIIIYSWNNIVNWYFDFIDEILQLGGIASKLIVIYFILLNIFIFTYVAFLPLMEVGKNYGMNDKVQISANTKFTLKEFLEGTSVFILYPSVIILIVGLFLAFKVLVTIYSWGVGILFLIILPIFIIYNIIDVIVKKIKK